MNDFVIDDFKSCGVSMTDLMAQNFGASTDAIIMVIGIFSMPSPNLAKAGRRCRVGWLSSFGAQ